LSRKYGPYGRTECRSDFEEFIDENADACEDDYDFASAGQGIRFRPNMARSDTIQERSNSDFEVKCAPI
jgi:hypothetical protein